jgi:hypothetical protein
MIKAYLYKDGAVMASGRFAPGNVPPGWTVETRVPKERIPVKQPVPVNTATTPADVSAERDRRLALGFDYDFGDARGVHSIGTTKGDEEGWDEVTKIALSRNATGSTDPINIMTDTGPAVVTPLEWLAVLEAAAAFRQPIWQASFVLQAMDPIPPDYAEDSHWPA